MKIWFLSCSSIAKYFGPPISIKIKFAIPLDHSLCGNQLPIWSQWSSCTGIHTFVYFSSMFYQGWSMWPIGYGRSDGMSLLKIGHKRPCDFSFILFLLNCLLWEMLATILWRRSYFLTERPLCEEKLRPTAREEWVPLTTTGMNLEANPLTQSSLGWLKPWQISQSQSHDRPWTGTKPLSFSLMPDSQKVWDN